MRRLLALLLLLPFAPHAAAAESYDGCAGFIDALPTTVSTQGTWCLRKDLATSITGGAAIMVTANNVTIDCNGFKLGGIGAGPASQASGVYAQDRLNITVRNCAIRGFHAGVRLIGNGGGHLVEDNRIDQSVATGIHVLGDSNLIQRNRIMDTGGATSGVGIWAEADIRDNTIDGVIGVTPVGIYPGGWGTEVRGNRVRGVEPGEGGNANGIITFGGQQSIIDNRVIGRSDGITVGVAIISAGETNAFCRDNLVAHYATAIYSCGDNGGNVVH